MAPHHPAALAGPTRALDRCARADCGKQGDRRHDRPVDRHRDTLSADRRDRLVRRRPANRDSEHSSGIGTAATRSGVSIGLATRRAIRSTAATGITAATGSTAACAGIRCGYPPAVGTGRLVSVTIAFGTSPMVGWLAVESAPGKWAAHAVRQPGVHSRSRRHPLTGTGGSPLRKTTCQNRVIILSAEHLSGWRGRRPQTAAPSFCAISGTA